MLFLERKKNRPPVVPLRGGRKDKMCCATLDRQIDALVYELYGLTEEEIKIVEGK